MDCRTTRDIFELNRVDSDSMDESELAEAAAHLATCPECEAVVERRSLLDQNIAQIMSDVPVPGGLKEEILEALASVEAEEVSTTAGDGENATAPPTKPTGVGERVSARRGSRRRLLAITITAAAGILAAVAAWQTLMPAGPSLTVAEIERSTPLDLSALPEFDGGFEPRLPADWQSSRWIHFASSPKGLSPAGSKTHPAALYAFRLQTRRNSYIKGILLVAEADSFGDVPRARRFEEGELRYFTSSQGSYATVSWTSNELTYVCFVSGGHEAQLLAQALHVPAA